MSSGPSVVVTALRCCSLSSSMNEDSADGDVNPFPDEYINIFLIDWVTKLRNEQVNIARTGSTLLNLHQLAQSSLIQVSERFRLNITHGVFAIDRKSVV